MEQCTAANDTLKCCNCKGNHLATSNDCPNYKDQEKRMQNLINQYAATSQVTTTALALHSDNEFPSLPNISQRQEFFHEIINVLSSKMEKNHRRNNKSTVQDSSIEDQENQKNNFFSWQSSQR
jgi:hypothetical protein